MVNPEHVNRASPGRAPFPGVRAILVFACNLLGDAICRLPATQAAKETYPGARLIVVAAPGCREVFEGQTFVDEVWVLPRSGGPLSQLQEWLHLLRRARRAAPELVLDLYGSSRTALFSRLCGATYRVGMHRLGCSRWYTRRPASGSEVLTQGHIIERINAAVAPAAIASPFAYRPLAVTEGERRQARVALGGEPERACAPLVVLNPGARVAAKRWPEARFGALARRAARAGWGRCVVISPPGQEELATALVAASEGAATALPVLGLKALAALLQEARVLVTGDTGVMHLGAAMGVPLVVIAGPTEPTLFSVGGARPTVLFHENACERWQEGDECARYNSCQDRTCLEAVSVDEVAAAVAGLLSESGA